MFAGNFKIVIIPTLMVIQTGLNGFLFPLRFTAHYVHVLGIRVFSVTHVFTTILLIDRCTNKIIRFGGCCRFFLISIVFISLHTNSPSCWLKFINDAYLQRSKTYLALMQKSWLILWRWKIVVRLIYRFPLMLAASVLKFMFVHRSMKTSVSRSIAGIPICSEIHCRINNFTTTSSVGYINKNIGFFFFHIFIVYFSQSNNFKHE